MKKPVGMSLETARQMYKENNEITNKWLLENFTKEELEPKKGFTWYDSFSGNGVLITQNSNFCDVLNYANRHHNKNIFLTEKHAKSALAFAQLSHICNKYNEGKKRWNEVYCVGNYKNYLSDDIISDHVKLQLEFYKREDAKTSMEVNRQLWLDYWMID